MAITARLWVAGELVNAAKMNTISTDLTELSGRVGTEIAAVSQTVTNAIAALGSASTRNIGTGDGNVPELDSGGHLDNARLSDIPNTALSTATGTASVSTPVNNNSGTPTESTVVSSIVIELNEFSFTERVVREDNLYGSSVNNVVDSLNSTNYTAFNSARPKRRLSATTRNLFRSTRPWVSQDALAVFIGEPPPQCVGAASTSFYLR